MKKTSRILAIVLTICMSITAMATLAACPDKGFELESFTVDMSTIKTTYKVGEQVDFSGIKVNIRFTDEKYNKQLGSFDYLSDGHYFYRRSQRSDGTIYRRYRDEEIYFV